MARRNHECISCGETKECNDPEIEVPFDAYGKQSIVLRVFLCDECTDAFKAIAGDKHVFTDDHGQYDEYVMADHVVYLRVR